MRTVRTVADLRAALAAARADGPVGFVPTMGALHDGHAALIRHAADTCTTVVVSVFVNPTQFDDAGDLAAYPRSGDADAALAAAAGADVLFLPDAAEVYPDGTATTVRVRGPLTETLEGAHRGTGHFDGVTTVVAALFGMVQPDRAVFGAKDAQQALVVRRMVRDLHLPVQIVVCPTVRDEDGLALSSRNARLGSADRPRALAISRALAAAADAAAAGEREPAALLAAARGPLAEAGLELDYLALVDPDTLLDVTDPITGEVLLAVAARVGGVRLIDNTVLTPIPDAAATR